MKGPMTNGQMLSFLRRDGWNGNVKVEREDAIHLPLTAEQVDRLHWTIQGEVNDPGIGQEEGEPLPLTFKGWTLLAMRLLWTIRDLQGRIARMQRTLADAQQDLWIPPNQGSKGRGYDVPKKPEDDEPA